MYSRGTRRYLLQTISYLPKPWRGCGTESWRVQWGAPQLARSLSSVPVLRSIHAAQSVQVRRKCDACRTSKQRAVNSRVGPEQSGQSDQSLATAVIRYYSDETMRWRDDMTRGNRETCNARLIIVQQRTTSYLVRLLFLASSASTVSMNNRAVLWVLWVLSYDWLTRNRRLALSWLGISLR